MDIESKLNMLRNNSYTANSQLQSVCAYIGVTNNITNYAVCNAIDVYVRAMVEQRVYEIVTSPEYFALMVHAGANYEEAQNGLSK